MTGAPLPKGTDAVVMIEHTRSEDDRVEVQRGVAAGENVVRKGSEALAGRVVLPRGRQLGAGEMGLLASVGQAQVCVFRQPTVAVLPTGDEVVPVEQEPEWFQIRNSNSMALAAQVAAAGGVPRPLGIAPDDVRSLGRLIERGLEEDLLLLSGGISVGKYDLVAQVLSEMGAELYFQGVAIRPGKPVTFGRIRDTFFFGLPGNPVSTFVTFELFARPAIALLSGADFECPVFLRARLGKPVRHKTGLTVFMPARAEMECGDPVVNLVSWQGSGDLVGVAAANCFLVVHPEQAELAAGDWVDVLPKPA
jgi:molybdopterin molybdotransferase